MSVDNLVTVACLEKRADDFANERKYATDSERQLMAMAWLYAYDEAIKDAANEAENKNQPEIATAIRKLAG